MLEVICYLSFLFSRDMSVISSIGSLSLKSALVRLPDYRFFFCWFGTKQAGRMVDEGDDECNLTLCCSLCSRR